VSRSKGDRLDTTFASEIQLKLDAIVATVNAADKTNTTKPNGAPADNGFTNRWGGSGTYERLVVNGTDMAGIDGTTLLGSSLTVRPNVTLSEVSTDANIIQGQVIVMATLATYVRTVMSTLSRYRKYTLIKYYHVDANWRAALINGPVTSYAHFNSNQVNYNSPATGTLPVKGSLAKSTDFLNFIDALKIQLDTDRENISNMEEIWCHTNCHGSCHGSRARR